MFSGHLKGPGERAKSLGGYNLERLLSGLVSKAWEKARWGLDQTLTRNIINMRFPQLLRGGIWHLMSSERQCSSQDVRQPSHLQLTASSSSNPLCS